MDGSQLPRLVGGEDRGGPIPPWTIKGVPQAERDKMNAAAKRAQMTLGQWLIETARLRTERERGFIADGRAVPCPASPEALPAADLSPADLAALMMALPSLAEGRRCGRLAQDVRRLLKHQLGRYLPAADQSPRALPQPQPQSAAQTRRGHGDNPSRTIPR